MADIRRGSSWLTVWSRAVVGPAARRALPVWIGAGLVAAVVFGGTGMHPADLTELAVRVPGVGAILGVTWLLVFVPTARVLVRADGARYLRSLPARRWPPVVVAGAALVVLQLPWLVLWLAGAGALGAAVVAVLTGALVLVARWRAPPPVVGTPRWRSDRAALRGIYARALRRRAGDALVRGAGLAILAGIAAGLFVRNNTLAAEPGAVLAAAVIAVVLVPGWAGALLPIVDAHRASAWLATSLGVTERGRVAVLATAIAGVYVATTLIAVVASLVVLDGSVAQLAWLAGLALATALALALAVTGAVLRADRAARLRTGAAAATGEATRPADTTPARVVVGAVVASALAVVALGWLGAPGVVALAVVGLLAMGTVS